MKLPMLKIIFFIGVLTQCVINLEYFEISQLSEVCDMSLSETEGILKNLVSKLINYEITKEKMADTLIREIDCDEVYNSNNLLITHCYFTLKHVYEEKITRNELIYFLDCFNGEKLYNLEDKLIIQENGSNEFI